MGFTSVEVTPYANRNFDAGNLGGGGNHSTMTDIARESFLVYGIKDPTDQQLADYGNIIMQFHNQYLKDNPIVTKNDPQTGYIKDIDEINTGARVYIPGELPKQFADLVPKAPVQSPSSHKPML